MATITVTRNSETFVRPYVPAPLETLELSAIDRVPGLRHAVRSLHVFRHSRREAGDKPADLIRAALSSALLDYYPLAGRFVGSVAAGDASVACTGDGALFIAAAADCSLEDVNCLDYPLMISEDELLPAPRGGVDPTTIPVMIQVTEFTCGGFVVGLSAVHTLADGLGAAQFINAIAEQSRGLPASSVRPVWARELIPNPPKPAIGPSPTFRSFGFQHLVADVAPDRIARAKAEYLEATGQYCSAFDVAVSKTWQARTRAVKCSPGAPVHVCFFANTRHLLAHSLPEGGRGFYGNCFYPVTVSASAGDAAAAGLLDVIKMIRDGKARLPAEFARWAAGGTRADPYELTFEYNVLFVSDWTRLGFLEVDYGWGPPSHVVPFSYAEFMAVAVLGTPPAPKKGTRIMTQCVGEKHLREFQDEMEAF